MTLNDRLSKLLNEESREGASNTPDFILAQFMMRALEAFEESVRMRDGWYDGPTPISDLESEEATGG